MSLIEIKDIHKTYSAGTENAYEALKGVSIKIEKGEFVAIMGPSGSGKSTLMHIIGLLDVPTSGEYILNDKNVSKQTDEELAHIRNREVGFVFQAFNLLPRMSVYDNVVLPYTYYEDKISQQEIDNRALEALKLVGLSERSHNMSNQLSGGQIQRTAIARCLVMNPSIILADEPTGNLDSKVSHEIMDTLKTINKKGNTVILVTHEDDIAAYADRIIRIKDGLVQDGKEQA